MLFKRNKPDEISSRMFYIGLGSAFLGWVSLPVTYVTCLYLLDSSAGASFLIALIPFAVLKVIANLITGIDG